MDADNTLTRRAAARLSKLLDEQGFPLDGLGRAKALSEALQISFQRAQQLLSGLIEWTIPDVQVLSHRFDAAPGYFLDANYGGPLPSDTVVAPASDGGEAIAWRAPNGFLRRPPARGLPFRYVTGRHDVFGHKVGTLFVYSVEPLTIEGVAAGDLCVIENERGLDVMRCRGSREAMASFESSEPGQPAVVVASTGTDSPGAHPRFHGRVVAFISAA